MFLFSVVGVLCVVFFCLCCVCVCCVSFDFHVVFLVVFSVSLFVLCCWLSLFRCLLILCCLCLLCFVCVSFVFLSCVLCLSVCFLLFFSFCVCLFFLKSFRPCSKWVQQRPKWFHEHRWPGWPSEGIRVKHFREIISAVLQIISKTAHVISRTSLTRLAFWRHLGQRCSWNNFGHAPNYFKNGPRDFTNIVDPVGLLKASGSKSFVK